MPFLDFTDADFQYFIDTYYGLLKTSFDDFKSVDAVLLLSVLDVYQLDFLKLKYFESTGKYYYLNKVSNYKPQTTTKIQLIEIK